MHMYSRHAYAFLYEIIVCCQKVSTVCIIVYVVVTPPPPQQTRESLIASELREQSQQRYITADNQLTQPAIQHLAS